MSKIILKNRYSRDKTRRKPYLYAVGWSKLDRYYVGVRFAEGCDPSELWNGYYTSSRYVRAFASTHGNPDVLMILGVFPDQQSAIEAEADALVQYQLHLHPSFLNKRAGKAINFDDEVKANMRCAFAKRPAWSDERRARHREALKGRVQTEATRQKMSEKSKGRKKSEAHRAALSAARKGKPWSEEAHRAQREAREARAAAKDSITKE